MSSRNWRGYWGFEPIEGTAHAHLRPGQDRASRYLGASLIFVIGFYRRLVSPLLGPTCRFHPSCSSYAVQAIHRYGPFGGSARALARLARCHPLSEGGYDPVR